MAGGALIPLLGKITPKCIYSIAKSFIYTLHMLVEFHLPTSLFSFLHNYSVFFIYLQYIIPTDYILTIPLLIQRGVRKSEHVSESFKLFSSKRFDEDFCNLIICGAMSKMDCLGLYMMSNQMILCVDVLISIMESMILGQLNFISIINQ